MDLLLLENRVRDIEKSVYELQMEIQSLKNAEKRLTLTEVTTAIERDLPKTIDLDHILENIRVRNKTQSEKPDLIRISKEDIEVRLKDFEKKYHMSSDVFYRQVQVGLLEEQEEYITWLGYFEAYQRLQEKVLHFGHDD